MRVLFRRLGPSAVVCSVLGVPARSPAQQWSTTTVQPTPSRTIQAIQWRSMRQAQSLQAIQWRNMRQAQSLQAIQWRNMQQAQSIQLRNSEMLRRNAALMDRYRSQLGPMPSRAAPGQVVRVPTLSTRVQLSEAARRLSDMRFEHQQRLQRTILDQNQIALREGARREQTLLRYRAYNRHAVDHLVADLRTTIANGFELRRGLSAAAQLIRPPSQLQSVAQFQRSYSARTHNSYSEIMMTIKSMSKYVPFGGMNQLSVIQRNTTTRIGS